MEMMETVSTTKVVCAYCNHDFFLKISVVKEALKKAMAERREAIKASNTKN